MTSNEKSIVILGAGVTGLTAAWALSRSYHGKVVVLEKEAAVGGLAATFTRNELSFDLGSHRLHEGYDPEVDSLVKDLCGDDLLRRERRGLMYLGGRALLYPPSPFDIIFAFGVWESFRFARDLLSARFRQLVHPREHEDFEGFTICMVGRSLYDRFYWPYALKLYGMPPREISKDPAVSRVREVLLLLVLPGSEEEGLPRNPHVSVPFGGHRSTLPHPSAAVPGQRRTGPLHHGHRPTEA